MRILHVAAEMFPLVKTGGLADVVGSLPGALCDAGVESAVVLPGYPAVMSGVEWVADSRSVELPGVLGSVNIRTARLSGSPATLFVIDSDTWFNRPGKPYGPDAHRAFSDNHLRFAALAAAAVDIAKDWRADVIHAHDWHAGMVGPYLSEAADLDAAHVFTIHNLAYQGLFGTEILQQIGLPDHLNHLDALEFHGLLSFMKGGIAFSDRVTTVSPTYAEEIQREEFGHGLEGLIRHRSDVMRGILNGVDYSLWNPESDKFIVQNYTAESLADREQNRIGLRELYGLEQRAGPLVGVVSRMTSQKGLDLLLAALPDAVESGIQFVILGSGDPDLEAGFRNLAERYPENVGVFLGYDESGSHMVFAGSDAILVPSRFEPCGLTQLYAMKYGSLPVVRRTGGLADTVVDLDASVNGTGFLFDDASADGLIEALRRMTDAFNDHSRWRHGMETAMAQDFSWDRAATEYIALYREVLKSA